MIELNVEKRDGTENNAKMRKEGYIPAVFYGPKEESTAVKITESAFNSVYSTAGESTIISVKEGSNEHESLIHDVQFDAISGRPIHADFYVIEKGKKIEIAVPLNFVGVAPAEKNLAGVLVKVMQEIQISALPKDLPSSIDADISGLVDFSSQLKASDLTLPEGVEFSFNVEENDEVIALVQEPKEEEVYEAPEDDLDSIEVEGEKKEGEEGGEGEGDAKPAEGGDDKGGE